MKRIIIAAAFVLALSAPASAHVPDDCGVHLAPTQEAIDDHTNRVLDVGDLLVSSWQRLELTKRVTALLESTQRLLDVQGALLRCIEK